jgi:hypothetical protein
MSTHHCHANDCKTITPQKLLMCAYHWAKVPNSMQKNVWASFKQRSLAPGADPASWANYYEACADAVEYVAMAEHKDTQNSYRRSSHNFRKAAAANFFCA